MLRSSSTTDLLGCRQWDVASLLTCRAPRRHARAWKGRLVARSVLRFDPRLAAHACPRGESVVATHESLEDSYSHGTTCSGKEWIEAAVLNCSAEQIGGSRPRTESVTIGKAPVESCREVFQCSASGQERIFPSGCCYLQAACIRRPACRGSLKRVPRSAHVAAP